MSKSSERLTMVTYNINLAIHIRKLPLFFNTEQIRQLI